MISRCMTDRSIGKLNNKSFENMVRSRKLDDIDLSVFCEIKSCQQGPIKALEIENIESRYLLSGAGDCTIALYDLNGTSSTSSVNNEDEVNGNGNNSNNGSKIEKMAQTTRTSNGNDGHSATVTSLQWFPVDTGCFISSSNDNTVKVWDTNQFQVVHHFTFREKGQLYTNVYDTPCTYINCYGHR